MTSFLWFLLGGFILGIVLMVLSKVIKKPVVAIIGIGLSIVCSFAFVLDITLEPNKNETVSSSESVDALSDEQFEELQSVFLEYTGKELEYRPVYCGEWREGKQYKTENYAYGQYLFNMDEDGHVHLIVWVQDEKGEEGREVIYNRLEDNT